MRRNSIPAWITGVCSVFLLSSNAAAATTRNLQSFQYPDQEETNGSYRPPPRVLIDAFLIELQGMSTSLTEVDLGDLLTVLESTASDYLMEKSKDDVPLEYVKFGRLVQEFRADDASFVAVDVQNGVARYTDHPAPDSNRVQNWVQESLSEEYLLPRLNSHPNANLRSVTGTSATLKYPSLPATASSTKATEQEPSGMGAAAMGAIIGSLGGILIVGMMVGGFLLVRKRRNQSQVVNVGEASEADVDNFKPPTNFNNERYGMRRAVADPDTRSIAGSESEWTVATEAGDSMAIKSIHPNGIVPSSPNTGALMFSESFERDRQVAITKDMLTSQWSGKVTNQRGPTPSSESVLQPSYFSASVERLDRETRIADNARLLPDMDSSSYSSNGTNNTERKKSSPRRGKQ